MLGKLKSLFISTVLFSTAPYLYGQSHKMPEPGVYSAMGDGVTPPPGLPLPIDDYLPLLLLAGLVYGAVKIPKLKSN